MILLTGTFTKFCTFESVYLIKNDKNVSMSKIRRKSYKNDLVIKTTVSIMTLSF